MLNFFVGLDVGKQRDYSAVTILERELARSKDLDWRGDFIVQSRYRIRYLYRFPLKTPYPVVAEKVSRMLEEPRLAHGGKLIMDATGVGEPVADIIKDKGVRPVSIKITSSMEVVHNEDWSYHVPKRDLVSALHVLVQSGKLKASKGLKYADIFFSELENFSYQIDRQTGHTTYEAMVEIKHDDLVTAVALAAWYATVVKRHTRLVKPGAESQDQKQSDWRPLRRKRR